MGYCLRRTGIDYNGSTVVNFRWSDHFDDNDKGIIRMKYMPIANVVFVEFVLGLYLLYRGTELPSLPTNSDALQAGDEQTVTVFEIDDDHILITTNYRVFVLELSTLDYTQLPLNKETCCINYYNGRLTIPMNPGIKIMDLNRSTYELTPRVELSIPALCAIMINDFVFIALNHTMDGHGRISFYAGETLLAEVICVGPRLMNSLSASRRYFAVAENINRLCVYATNGVLVWRHECDTELCLIQYYGESLVFYVMSGTRITAVRVNDDWTVESELLDPGVLAIVNETTNVLL
jgi:hypothetical protein